MVQFDDISDAARHQIVAGASPLIARHDEAGLGAPGEPLVLGPSLREEYLTLDAIRGEAPKTLEPTGQTVSLLEVPGEHETLGAGPGAPHQTLGFVLAGPSKHVELESAAPQDWSVSAVSSSDLSTRIQAALNWIDEDVGGNPMVRVLTVPSYQVTALSLRHGDELVGVVPLPFKGETTFEARHVYSLDEFVEKLRGLPKAEGLAVPVPLVRG